MHGYNEVMAESDTAFKIESHGKAGANLAQMMVNTAGSKNQRSMTELAMLKEENQALQKVIEQMKIDMETIVDKVKQTLTEQQQND